MPIREGRSSTRSACPNFLDEPHDVDVVGEPVMIEFFEPRPAYEKTVGKPPNAVVSFQHRGANPVSAELVCRGKPAELAPDHYHMGPGRTASATHRS